MNKSNQGIILGVGIAGGVIAAMAILYSIGSFSASTDTDILGRIGCESSVFHCGANSWIFSSTLSSYGDNK